MVTEEVKQGRARISAIRNMSLTAAATLAIPPTQNRVALLLSCHNTIDYTLDDDANAVLFSGINMFHGQVPLLLRIEDLGQIVQRGFYVIASAPGTIEMIEVIEEET